MLIVCPSCATSYDVEPASLQPNGRQVRCLRCRAVWRAELNQADRLRAAAGAMTPDLASERIPLAPEAEEDVAFAETAANAAADAAWSLGPLDEPPEAEILEPAAAGSAPDLADSEAADPQSASDDLAAMDTPPTAPVDLDASRPPIDINADYELPGHAGRNDDIESYAARYSPRSQTSQKRGWPMAHLQIAILALVIIDSILVGWREDVVRFMPQTARFYSLIGLPVNLRGLAFDGVSTSTEQHDGVPILVVEGNIVNETGTMISVPRLRLAVRNAARQEIYSWTATPPRATLSPGERVAFRIRLASPPPEARDVLVRFITRRDVVADAR